jgi:hypothetical protein
MASSGENSSKEVPVGGMIETIAEVVVAEDNLKRRDIKIVVNYR